MTFHFKPAVRENVSVLLAFAGPSGSGKTKSALRVAEGLADGGAIAFLDTEARRALHYADQHKFLHAEIGPPFRPERFLEAIHDAESAGAKVIIIDSFSHEYDGDGGVLDWAAEIEAGGTKPPGNWKVPKLAHKKLMNGLLQCRASLIFCLRADEKIEIVREGGRTQVRPLGWMPICEKRFMYEMTASFTLTADNPGKPNFSLPHKCQEQHRGFFPAGKFIDEDAGRAIAAWARGDTTQRSTVQQARPQQPAEELSEDDVAELIIKGDDKATEGTEALAAWWQVLSLAQRKAIGAPQLAKWKVAAARNSADASLPSADASGAASAPAPHDGAASGAHDEQQAAEDQSQDAGADDFPGDAPHVESEADKLLDAARGKATEGRRAFDAYYQRLRPDQKKMLEPHMQSLMKMASSAAAAGTAGK